jgi:hypothetical protein
VGQQFFGYAGDTGCTDQMIGLDHADCILVRSGKNLRRDAIQNGDGTSLC